MDNRLFHSLHRKSIYNHWLNMKSTKLYIRLENHKIFSSLLKLQHVDSLHVQSFYQLDWSQFLRASLVLGFCHHVQFHFDNFIFHSISPLNNIQQRSKVQTRFRVHRFHSTLVAFDSKSGFKLSCSHHEEARWKANEENSTNLWLWNCDKSSEKVFHFCCIVGAPWGDKNGNAK